MQLSGLHLLLTNRCTYECDHCFMWGSPWQNGVMTLENIRHILRQGKDVRTVKSIYFEGGEPFLFYSVMLKGIQEAVEMGFKVGIVSNSYWATSVEDALEWLSPLVGLIGDLSVSSDLYHGEEVAKNAAQAAQQLGIPIGEISIAQPEAVDAAHVQGQLPLGGSAVMYRGRAVEKLAPRATTRLPWEQFTTCPHEDLRDPGRVHVDPFGYMHVCQGISIGNIYQTPLREICKQYDPDTHSIAGPLLAGGPAELVRRYSLSHADGYADACHLCYTARLTLRERFPDVLAPGEMYGIYDRP